MASEEVRITFPAPSRPLPSRLPPPPPEPREPERPLPCGACAWHPAPGLSASHRRPGRAWRLSKLPVQREPHTEGGEATSSQGRSPQTRTRSRAPCPAAREAGIVARIVPDALWLLRMPALLPHPPPPPSKRTEKHLRGFSGVPTAKESGPRKSPADWRDFSGGDSSGAWGEISGVNSSKEESVESSPHPQGQGRGAARNWGAEVGEDSL